MLKRKYGERPSWKRISQKRYAQNYLETDEYKGYVTLLQMTQVTEPLIVHYGKRKVSIADDGYIWLQQFPADQHHSVTTMFDAKGNIIQWYIDICLKTGCEEGKPWMDDLFLDIIYFPSGEIIEKDADELEDAYSKGIIDRELYALAWDEFKRIKSLLDKKEFTLVNLSALHRDLLLGQLK